MKALVVYESLWGNTAAIAESIAEGIGAGARAVPTGSVHAAEVVDADLIVAGAPVLGFSLPTDAMRDSVARTEANAPRPPDLTQPSMRSWLESLPRGHARTAAFETRIWWSPRGAAGDIEKRFERAGYQRLAPARKFVVEDKYGPLRPGELEKAHAWGQELARSLGS